MKKVLLLNKKEGETPLAAIEKFRKHNPKYQNIKMTYAGRLDPMASGLLLVLAGEECKNKGKYLALDKEYEFEVLFGVATDTYDILGKVIPRPHRSDLWDNPTLRKFRKEIDQNLKFFMGNFIQEYPPYSSKTVAGIQLFEYARGGIEVEAPVREVFVKKLELLRLRKITGEKLLENISKRIKKVEGDFRQEEILKLWHETLSVQHSVFNIGSFRIKCGSGTYVRGIANSLGEKIGIPALAFSIKRTRVGKYK